MSEDSLGDRMKGYEIAAWTTLPRRMPVVLRVDGKAFHSYTKGLARPFDEPLCQAMDTVALSLCAEVQGAQLAYVQSDEISVLIHGYKRLSSQPWFGNDVQKMVSCAAAEVSSRMTEVSPTVFGRMKRAKFDARVFVVPENDVCNYFLWRQQDARRNSVQMVTRSMFSDQQCFQRDITAMKEMCASKGVLWDELPTYQRYGRCARRVPYDHQGTERHRWEIDREIPLFSDDRSYVERYLPVEAESDLQARSPAAIVDQR